MVKRVRLTRAVETSTGEVGYGKPPKHSQFKPGQSGNPQGRPKGSRNSSDRSQMRATGILRHPSCFAASTKAQPLITLQSGPMRIGATARRLEGWCSTIQFGPGGGPMTSMR